MIDRLVQMSKDKYNPLPKANLESVMKELAAV